MKLNLLILSIAPTIAFIIWCYLKDKYDKEPIIILCKFFILGAFISVIAIIAEDFLIDINRYSGYSNLLYMSFIVAGFTEEGLKALVLIPNLLKEKSFNEKLDGIIYSIFLSLGFATIENIIYIFFEESKTALEVGVVRGIISVPAHIMFAITMGYYISKYKFSNKAIKKREYLFMSILVPILLHGIFDFIAMIKYKFSFVVFFIYIILLWKVNLDKVDEYSDNSRKRFLRGRKNKK
ncbi:PrsW family intramembrane metalloprotease [[Clostridium] dakarense]|uniref:PrsW family intramembrane metalloprotease n=1 Tax=Faecalimicrobium dakarense TaxID=1301100 RepID=UPI0004B8E9B5|nr:PrsW family glutamic-type intramembrane protease [[Clostridium] dakarense]